MSSSTQVTQPQSSAMASYLTYVPSVSYKLATSIIQLPSLAGLGDLSRRIQYTVFGQAVTDLPEEAYEDGMKALELFKAFMQCKTEEAYQAAKEALRVFNDNHNHQLSRNAAELELLFQARNDPITLLEEEVVVPSKLDYTNASNICRRFTDNPTEENYLEAEKEFHALHKLEKSRKVNKKLDSLVGEPVGVYLIDFYIGALIGDSCVQIDLELIYLKYLQSPFAYSVTPKMAADIFKLYLENSIKTEVDDEDVEYFGALLEKQLSDVMENHTINEDLISYVDEDKQHKMIDQYREREASDFTTPREEAKVSLRRIKNKIEKFHREGVTGVPLEAALRQKARIKQELATLPKEAVEPYFSPEEVQKIAQANRAQFLAFLGIKSK